VHIERTCEVANTSKLLYILVRHDSLPASIGERAGAIWSLLQSTLQFMGCKALLANKVPAYSKLVSKHKSCLSTFQSMHKGRQNPSQKCTKNRVVYAHSNIQGPDDELDRNVKTRFNKTEVLTAEKEIVVEWPPIACNYSCTSTEDCPRAWLWLGNCYQVTLLQPAMIQ
jgi:hypothetical protein